MDPVAAQFLDQLDQATGVLPASVHAGLVMCGSDAAPGLVERLRDTERALPTRVFSALVLADQKLPEGWAAMVDVIAGGAVRALCEVAGIQNILTKCIGTNQPHNVILATIAGLEALREPEARQQELATA